MEGTVTNAGLLTMSGITKTFPGVCALDNVNFTLEAGEVHVLLGENGAGKSTLMKILSGSYHADSGEIFINGSAVHFNSPIDALRNGVTMIYQELNPVPYMTIAENIFLGKEIRLCSFGLLDKRAMYNQTTELLSQFGMNHLLPSQKMIELSVAETQMIEIIKAYSCKTKIIIMDEPTSALAEHEVEKLFSIIKMLKKQNVGIVYISHKMEEIFSCADRISIFRDGRYVVTRKIEEIDRQEAIRFMIGRELIDQYPPKETVPGEVVLQVENLSDENERCRGVSFTLHRGEIVGIAGLMGSGRSEVVETIFGIRKRKTGRIKVAGKVVNAKGPDRAINAGIALVTEDRKGSGLNLKSSVRENISICTLAQISRAGVLVKKKEMVNVDTQIKNLGIKTPFRDQIVNFLSGGNQQKVVVSKWLLTDPDVFIMDEPTRGIDIGAKHEIYNIMINLARQGKGILIVSSELPEILGLCDRTLVMHEGNLAGELSRGEFSQEKIMQLATGTKEAVS
jgi:inositol transport system ATP-binding protein